MGKAKKQQRVRQNFATTRRMISQYDSRLKEKDRKMHKTKIDRTKVKINRAPQQSSALFFEYNDQLGPPYHILLDTNFINFSIKNKIDLFQGMLDCLYAKCTVYLTDCVLAELEKLGQKYRLALKIVKDPRIVRLPCLHQGTYADDCLVNRVTQHKCYIVATCDKDLKRRLRKIPGVPIMFVSQHRYTVEQMPDAFGAPK